MIYAIVSVIVLIMDQAMKYWTTRNIPLNPGSENCVELFKGLFRITDVHNYGAAFNILQNARWLLVGVTVVFTVAVIVLISREVIHTRFGKWTAILVMAGAISNGLDRALFGYVVDMFEFEFWSGIPVFNIADMFITVCGILFCLHVIFHKETEEELAVKQNEESAEKENQYEPDFNELAPVARKPKKSEAPRGRVKREGHVKEQYTPTNQEDPFAEWEIGSGGEPAAPKKRYEKPQDEEYEPEDEKSSDLFSFEPSPLHKKAPKVGNSERPAQEKSAKTTSSKPYAEPEKKPEPQKKETPAKTDGDLPEFNLEDILAEFGDDQK
jgi:signal peptidase II